MRRELVTKSTPGGCDQFETSPEANDQELRTAFCERRQTDRLNSGVARVGAGGANAPPQIFVVPILHKKTLIGLNIGLQDST